MSKSEELVGREDQLKTMVVMGIPVKVIRRMMLWENMVVALVGALGGLGLAIVYNRLVFIALNGVWKDVVRTDMMYMDVNLSTLLTGLLITLVVAFLTLFFPLTRKLKKLYPASPGRSRTGETKSKRSVQLLTVAGFGLSGVAGLVLIGTQLIRFEVVNVPVFFAAGGLLLISSILFFIWYLGRNEKRRESVITVALLSKKMRAGTRPEALAL